MKAALSSLILVSASFSLDAAVINFAGYSYDDTTNIVVGGGHEWLRWTVTQGMSIDDALATYSANGWQVATNSQMSSLFNAFQFTNASTNYFDSLENTAQYLDTGTDGPSTQPDDPESNFVTMFGNTWPNYGSDDETVDAYEYTSAYFGVDGDNDGAYNLAYVWDDFQYDSGTSYYHTAGAAGLREDYATWTSSTSSTVRGVSLVREMSPVPIPAALPLFASGLGLLGFINYRRKC